MIAVDTEVNVVFNDEPTLATAVMIATAMPAAMRPYSIAVAPDSSRNKRMIVDIKETPSLSARAEQLSSGGGVAPAPQMFYG